MRFFRKGFTLVELLVIIVLFLILGTLLFYVLIKALKFSSSATGGLKTETSIGINTDILAFDIKHVGYGISKNETSLVLSYCNGIYSSHNDACKAADNIGAIDNKTLILKETSEYTTSCKGSNPTLGFAMCRRNETGTVTTIVSGIDKVNDNYRFIAMNLYKVLVNDTVTYGSTSCSAFSCDKLDFAFTNNETYIFFPYRVNKACKNSADWCCKGQYCSVIAWYLKTPAANSLPQACRHLGTYVLYRNVVNATGNFINYQPVVNCVSDWDVWFGLDTDGDTIIDKWVNEIPNADINNNVDLATKLKAVRIYLLVQTSYSFEKDYDFCGSANVECYSSDCPNTTDTKYIKVGDLGGNPVCLKVPQNDSWVHYRWKIVEQTYNFFPNLKSFLIH
jgi:type IV pilus assembly protein PilW